MERDNPSPPDATHVEESTRVVAFPGDNQIREEKVVVLRPKGAEMKRTLTQEEKDLAAAGYEHLHPSSSVNKDEKETSVDITEHQLGFDALVDTLKTNFDVKDPGHSFGLTADEAKSRLERDGPNILTPPKKKSALRKVCGLRPKACVFAFGKGKEIDNPYSSWNGFSPCLTFFLWSLVYWNTLS